MRRLWHRLAVSASDGHIFNIEIKERRSLLKNLLCIIGVLQELSEESLKSIDLGHYYKIPQCPRYAV